MCRCIMRLSTKTWADFGRWMIIVSGIVMLTMVFYDKQDVVSLMLKIWGGLFGVYCIYLGLFK